MHRRWVSLEVIDIFMCSKMMVGDCPRTFVVTKKKDPVVVLGLLEADV